MNSVRDLNCFRFLTEFVRVSPRHPGQALFFARTVAGGSGPAPPIAIFSITNKGNLSPRGSGIFLRPPGARDSRRPAAMSLALFPTERCNTDVAARPHTVGLYRALDQACGDDGSIAALPSDLGKLTIWYSDSSRASFGSPLARHRFLRAGD